MRGFGAYPDHLLREGPGGLRSPGNALSALTWKRAGNLGFLTRLLEVLGGLPPPRT